MKREKKTVKTEVIKQRSFVGFPSFQQLLINWIMKKKKMEKYASNNLVEK